MLRIFISAFQKESLPTIEKPKNQILGDVRNLTETFKFSMRENSQISSKIKDSKFTVANPKIAVPVIFYKII